MPAASLLFLAAMLDDARGATRNEPGSVRVEGIQDAREPNRMCVGAVNADRAAFADHAPAVVGSGPSIVPSDADWHTDRKAR
jgi:hypothetical protein